MQDEWRQFAIWKNVSREEFQSSAWQDKSAVTRVAQLEPVIRDFVSPAVLGDIECGVLRSGMSIRLNPYIISLINWHEVETDGIRRQFLPMASELEDDHPCLVIDSLEETSQSPVPGLVHRYPDKVLFLATSVCPVYCQYCTRSYAVGMDTRLVQKEHVISAKNWTAALDYIRANPRIEDVVLSGGDVARLKAANIGEIGKLLLDIPHIRRIRLATKALSVQPMKFTEDVEWLSAVLDLVRRGRKLFKDVCIHTHFNHPQEVTAEVEQVMRRLHAEGVFVRNQTVLLRGVNDDAMILRSLLTRLGAVHIHPYYVYLCDMVKSTEHFRVSLAAAQAFEKKVRGITAGFNTPLFVVDTPGGKRSVHSAEFYDRTYGISFFVAPVVAPGKQFNYFDPLRSLRAEAKEAWQMRPRGEILAGVRMAASPQPRRTKVPAQYAASVPMSS